MAFNITGWYNIGCKIPAGASAGAKPTKPVSCRAMDMLRGIRDCFVIDARESIYANLRPVAGIPC